MTGSTWQAFTHTRTQEIAPRYFTVNISLYLPWKGSIAYEFSGNKVSFTIFAVILQELHKNASCCVSFSKPNTQHIRVTKWDFNDGQYVLQPQFTYRSSVLVGLYKRVPVYTIRFSVGVEYDYSSSHSYFWYLVDVSGQNYTPTNSYSMNRRMGGSKYRFGQFGEEEIFASTKIRTPGRPASSLVSITTELSQLHIGFI